MTTEQNQGLKNESKILGINEIKEYLPHRYPLLLVDRVVDYELGKTITAIKNVTVNEEFFNGHFPHKPVMPGVLMIEALAQTAAILSFMTMNVKPDENSVVYFVGIDNARFKRPVEPGQYTGFYPMAKNAEWEKSAAIVRNLSSMREKMRMLEKQIKQLTENAEQK